MHRTIGAAIVALGVLLAALGLLIILAFGPDGRWATGPHEVDTDGIAVVTAPKLIRWKNLQVEILAEVPVNKPVFVGLGNSVDVQSYLAGVQRVEVTTFERPWKIRTRQVSGKAQLDGAPTALDWWLKQSAGLGGASINATLPDETVSAAVLSIGDSNLRGLTVTLAYGLKGAFFKGLGLLLGGIGVIWGGLLARRGETIWKTDDRAVLPASAPPAEGEEEVVYVWVDEHGVEHEMTPEEAARYEVVEVVEEVEPEREPEPPAGRVAPEAPAGRVAPEARIETAEPDLDTAAEPPTRSAQSEEPVTYFWIDDDGVEHEISEEELDNFDLIEDDDEQEGDK